MAVTSTSNVLSFSVKKVDCDWILVQFSDNAFTNYFRVWVNVATGVVGNVVYTGAASGAQVTTYPQGDGWYRVEIGGLPDSVTGNRWIALRLQTGNSGSQAYNSSVDISSFQFESGYIEATSYIATSGVTATRAAENFSLPWDDSTSQNMSIISIGHNLTRKVSGTNADMFVLTGPSANFSHIATLSSDKIEGRDSGGAPAITIASPVLSYDGVTVISAVRTAAKLRGKRGTGAFSDQAVGTAPWITSNAGTFNIGKSAGGSHFRGYVAVFAALRELTDAEVNAIFSTLGT
jgi:hypothetical protein